MRRGFDGYRFRIPCRIQAKDSIDTGHPRDAILSPHCRRIWAASRPIQMINSQRCLP